MRTGPKNKQSAGSSAAREGVKRDRAAGQLQKYFALAAIVGAVALFVVLIQPRLALPAVGLILVVMLFLVIKGRFGRRDTAHSWKRGSLGELRTSNCLKGLPGSYVSFHDVAMSGSKANVDHVVIGPTGLFVLDSKNWNGQAKKTLTGWKYGVALERTAEATEAESAWVTSVLQPEVGRWNVPVVTAWVMTEKPQPVDVINTVVIIHLSSLLSFIQSRPNVLSNRQVRRLVAHANDVFADR